VRRVCWLAFWLPLWAGCVMVEVGVTNPVVGLTTVAVVPFFNLSQERAVDGRRFASAYFTELQKTPGFQVIPVGVVEQAIFDHRLEMNNPDDVLQLAQLLGADAVVVGAVTDYSPYYPPRIGLQVSWYSTKPWTFYPGIPIDEFARDIAKPRRFSLFKPSRVVCEECPPELTLPEGTAVPVTVRGQSPTDRELAPLATARTVSLPEFLLYGETGAPRQLRAEELMVPEAPPQALDAPASPPPPGQFAIQPPTPEFNPRQPLMSYTRMFDGADPKLTARLRDYVELSGDLRAGGWESYLYRSEDFIRFTAHVMIVEMLQLHGGEARKRIVFKLRKYR
jgi:hypothetical protein